MEIMTRFHWDLHAIDRKWWILFAMSLSLGMTFIDQSAVAIALPEIKRVFDLSPVSLQWIMNAYLLALAIFLVFSGRLGDLFQHHRIFIIGVWIFFLGSMGCAIAPNIYWLIGSRIIQGMGAGFMLPNAPVIVLNTFLEFEKGKAMGIYTGSALIFLPFAFLIGGLFTQFLSWRLIFWLNLPLCIIAFLITHILIKTTSFYKEKKGVDFVGFIILSLATSSLIVALMEISARKEHGHLIILSFSSFLLLSMAYYYLKRHEEQPIIDFTIFRNKLFSAATILFFCVSISIAVFIYDAIFYQEVLGYAPVIAGILFFPNILCIMIASPLAGKLYDKYDYQLPILSGLLLMTLGLFLKALAAPLHNYWYLLPGVILISIGSPFILSPINTAALSSVEEKRQGMASSILIVTRQISNSIILACLTTIIIEANRYFHIHFLKSKLQHFSTLSLSHFEKAFATGQVDKFIKLNQEVFTSHYPATAQAAFTYAYSIGLYACSSLTFIVLIIIWILFKKIKNTTLHQHSFNNQKCLK